MFEFRNFTTYVTCHGLFAGIFFTFGALPLHALELSHVPLDVRFISALPNVMAIVDNSAVMDAEILTAESDGLFQGMAYLFPQGAYNNPKGPVLGSGREIGPSLRKDWRTQWNGYNRLYYDPEETYLPWPDTNRYTFEPADLQRPWSNPIPDMDEYARLRLADPFFTVVSRHKAIVVPNAHYFTVEDLNDDGTWEPGEPVYLTTWTDADTDGNLDIGNDPGTDHRRYYRYNDDGDGLVEDDELIQLTDEAEYSRIRPVWNLPGKGVLRFKSDREDLQNFANWVSYYRRRLLSVKAAASRSISGIKEVRAGLLPLNGHTSVAVQPINLAAGNSVIVDNQDAEFATLGQWHTVHGSHAWGGEAIYSDQEGDVAVYRPNLPAEGRYEVSAWWPCGGADMDNALIHIRLHQAVDVISLSMDQSQNGPNGCGRWVRLGGWDFSAGSDSTVQLLCTRNGRWIYADAIRFTRLVGTDENEDGAHDILNQLYGLDPQGGKNIRYSLDKVGRYFHRDLSSIIGASPQETEEHGGGCQQNLALMITDGIWNGPFGGVGNSDGGLGVPYADPWADTLADVASHYYTADLAPGLPDQAVGTGCDSAVHQHMTTFAIGLGGEGNIDPYDMDGDGQKDDPGYVQAPCFRDPDMTFPLWPQPVADHVSCIDDLRHAVVNGRGGYYNFPRASETDDAGGFQVSVSRLPSTVRPESMTGELSMGGTLLEDGSMIYQTRYHAGSWTGDVLAFANNTDSNTIPSNADEALWSAGAGLASSVANPDARRIISYGDIGGKPQGHPFRYNCLSEIQKKMLGSDLRTGSPMDFKASALLDFLRGVENDRFRSRKVLLGDIVNSSPLVIGSTLYVGANDGMLHAFDTSSGQERFAYLPHGVFHQLAELGAYDYARSHRFFVDGSPTAGDVLVDQFQRDTLLIGGYGKGGQGYFCLLIRRRIRNKSESEFGPYQDDFNVDAISDANTEKSISSIVMWEYPRPNPAEDDMDNDGDGLTDEQGEFDPDIGYSLGQGYAVNANVSGEDRFRPVVIFPNGYNSPEGRAVLYILDALTGELIRKIDTGAGGDNGLSVPALIDVDSDHCIDYAYAGDLKGNLWKFDLSSTMSGKWGVAYGDDLNNNGVIDASEGDRPMPLFGTCGQAITARPDVMAAQSACAPQSTGYLVVFGTGRYLGLSDKTNVSRQSIYGIWDYGDDSDDSEYLGVITDRSDGTLSGGLRLVPQEISSQTTVDGAVYRHFDKNHPVDYNLVEDTKDGDGYSVNDDHRDQQPNPMRDAGWFFDFPAAPDKDAEPGERVISDVSVRGGRAIVISYVPESRPCATGGSAWLYLLDGCFSKSARQDDNEENMFLRCMTGLRFDHRLTARSLVFKEPRSLLEDQLLIPDKNGRMMKISFSGEVWGKSYWRQNFQ